MFGKKAKPIYLCRKTVEALQMLEFVLTDKELARNLGRWLMEVDIFPDPDPRTNFFWIYFFTEKDFAEATAKGLSRPPDERKIHAYVDPSYGKVIINGHRGRPNDMPISWHVFRNDDGSYGF